MNICYYNFINLKFELLMTARIYSDRDKLVSRQSTSQDLIFNLETSVYCTLQVINIHYSNFNNCFKCYFPNDKLYTL